MKNNNRITQNNSSIGLHGSTVQSNGGVEKEVSKKIQAGWGAWKRITGVMCDTKVPIKLKGKMYKTMVRPAIMYGMETVAVTKVQEEKMNVTEMKMLRWSIGVTKMDRIRNENIREKLRVGEISEKLREGRLRMVGPCGEERRNVRGIAGEIENGREGDRNGGGRIASEKTLRQEEQKSEMR
jgi:hypothetical protein